ncbi:MAG: COQ9 family protein [Rickettsiales bacterium]
MPAKREEIRQRILHQALVLAPFEGWTSLMLGHAAEKAGFARLEAERVFPNGIPEILEKLNEDADRQLESIVAGTAAFKEFKIREKIAFCVKTRLSAQTAHKEAIRRAVAYTILPQNAALGLKTLYRTVDTIWRLAGDTSTDFNFYTKRMLLAKVYSATLLYWLDDASAEHTDTWQFLTRQINGVLAFGKWKAKTEERGRNIMKASQKFWREWRPRPLA